jgi:hypothetical protein
MPVNPPFLSSLPQSARIAYPAIQRGVAEGLSSTRIYNALREQGIRIGRQTAFDTIRMERGVAASGSYLSRIPRNLAANPARLPTSLYAISNNFQYTLKISGVLEATGQLSTVFLTINSDESLSREDLENLGIDAATRKGTEYELDVLIVEVVRGVKAPGLSIS